VFSFLLTVAFPSHEGDCRTDSPKGRTFSLLSAFPFLPGLEEDEGTLGEAGASDRA
jgi:hypothetical protein